LATSDTVDKSRTLPAIDRTPLHGAEGQRPDAGAHRQAGQPATRHHSAVRGLRRLPAAMHDRAASAADRERGVQDRPAGREQAVATESERTLATAWSARHGREAEPAHDVAVHPSRLGVVAVMQQADQHPVST
jgi:hypothetical protein